MVLRFSSTQFYTVQLTHTQKVTRVNDVLNHDVLNVIVKVTVM